MRNWSLAGVLLVLVFGCAGSDAVEPAEASGLSAIHFARGLRASQTLNDKKAEFHFEQAAELAPLNPRVQYRLAASQYAGSRIRGVDELDGKQLALAIDRFDRAIELDPDFASAYEGRAWANAMLGNGKAARDDLLTASALDTSLVLNFCDCSKATRSPQLAYEYLDDQVKKRPDDPFWIFKRANALVALGREEEALADYVRSIRLNPTFLLPKLAFAEAALGGESAEKAALLIEELKESDMSHPAVSELVGLLELSKARPERAVAAFTQVLIEKPDDERSMAGRARAYYELGNVRAALLDLEAAHLLEPRRLLGMKFDTGISLDSLDDVQELRSDRRVAELDAVGLFALAHELAWSFPRGRGEAAEFALELFGRTLELEPDLALAYLSRGILFQELGRTDEALSDFNRALELEPRMTRALNNRGNLYADLGETDKAVMDYSAALALLPEFPWPARNLGLLEMDARPEIALNHFSRAIFYDPEFVEAYEDRAWVYERLGNFPASRIDLALAGQLRGSTLAGASVPVGPTGE